MRICVLIFLLAFFAHTSCKKKVNLPPADNGPIYSLHDAFDFQKVAMAKFNTEPRIAADFFLKAATAYLQNAKRKDVGLCLSNASYLYEEQFNDLDSALILAKSGLEHSLHAKDTLSIGHGYRYVGYLMGKHGQLEEGLATMDKSIPYYEFRKAKDAIAVVDYDKARIYHHNKQYENADKYLKLSTDYFKTNYKLQRIFNNNLFGLKLYKDSGNKAQYEVVKKENESLIQSGKIDQHLQNKFNEILKH